MSLRRVAGPVLLAALAAAAIISAAATLPAAPRTVADVYHHPRPARPVEVSARGGVRHYPMGYWNTEDTDTNKGEYVVSRTAQGTWGLSGIVESDLTGGGTNRALVTLTSCTPREVRLTARTNVNGEFAFVDVPTTSWWVLGVWPPRGSGGSYVAAYMPGPKGDPEQLTIELTRKPQTFTDSPPLAAPPSAFKAAARQAKTCSSARHRR